MSLVEPGRKGSGLWPVDWIDRSLVVCPTTVATRLGGPRCDDASPMRGPTIFTAVTIWRASLCCTHIPFETYLALLLTRKRNWILLYLRHSPSAVLPHGFFRITRPMTHPYRYREEPPDLIKVAEVTLLLRAKSWARMLLPPQMFLTLPDKSNIIREALFA